MFTKKLFILFAVLGIGHLVMSQPKNRVTITADISGYKGKLPISSHLEWQGKDTLVPIIINGKSSSSHIMGAEYLVFPSRLQGDSLHPLNDALRSRDLRIRRTVATIENNHYNWTFYTDQPIEVQNHSLLGGTHLVYPGDSVHVRYADGNCIFSGQGSERFRITYNIKKSRESMPMPDSAVYPLDITRFLKRNQYLDAQIDKTIQILEANRKKISTDEYNWIKGKTLSFTEPNRWLYFRFIANPALKEYKDQKLSYTPDDLVKVWDSTMYKPATLWWRSSAVQNIRGVGEKGQIESIHSVERHRRFNFQDFGVNDTLKNPPTRKKLLYQKLKENYTGLFREKLLCNFIQEEITQEIGAYSWFAQSILRDYYNTPGFPAYKAWMQKWEKEHQYLNTKNGVTPLFYLEDQQGMSFSHRNTEGKFAIVNFWYSGCEPCKQQAAALAQIIEKTKSDTNIVFLHVSTDTDQQQWKKSMAAGEYVPKGGIQLWTGGQGKKHEMIKDFNVVSFPTTRMFDAKGKIVIDNTDPYATNFSGERLLAIATRKTPEYQDGPYVFYEQGALKTIKVNNNNIEALKPSTRFTALTENFDRSFQFSLQKKIEAQPSIYPAPDKMLVFSDIEGNFGALRKLLQKNQVIDENFNWTFGKGHLIFGGDMFDRGEQVTECLWLIYSLEEKALAAGGKVHFILGNHEIMNLQGDDRYVKDKYKVAYTLMGKALPEVYGNDSELGRWLRSKNIVEKIGNMLFCHGGISRAMNQTSLTLEQINQLAREHYAHRKEDYGSANVNTILSSRTGPFWYRGYYAENYREEGQENIIDSTLQKFNVSRIVTGHSIVADTISVHYDGKIINTDVKHASGRSEALLVENNCFYRATATGSRFLLFNEHEKALTKRNINRPSAAGK